MRFRAAIQRGLVRAVAGNPSRRYRRSASPRIVLPPIPRALPPLPAPRKLSERESALLRQFTVYVPPHQLKTYRPPIAPPLRSQTAVQVKATSVRAQATAPAPTVQPCIMSEVVMGGNASLFGRCTATIRRWAGSILASERNRAGR